jgi:DNA invertase Pin-like site-specific DNA recombinase
LILGAGGPFLPLIPFTTPHNRGLRISAFCGELQKAEFEGNVIRKRMLAGLKTARARGRVGGRPEKLSVSTVYKQVGAVVPEK